MRFSRHIRCWLVVVTTLLFFDASARRAEATCYVCDEVVELDNALANCLLKDFDRHLTRVRQSSERYSDVDLSRCVGSDGNEKRGIITMPVPGSTMPAEPADTAPFRTVYIMDEESLLCLHKLIVPLKGKLSPVRLFDLTKECAP